MNCKIKLLSILLVLLCLFEVLIPFAGLAYAAPIDERLTGFEKVGETDALALYYNAEKIAIAVLDKKSDFLWTSTVDENKIDTDELNDEIKTSLESLFLITYTDLTKDADNISKKSYLRLKTKVDKQPIDNGIKLTFKMEELNMNMDLEIFLDGDMLKIRIPSDGIVESVGVDDELKERMAEIKNSIKEIRKDFDRVKDTNIPEIKNLLSKAETNLGRAEEKAGQIKNVYGLNTHAQALYNYTTSFRSAIKGSRDSVGIIEKLEPLTKGNKKAKEALKLCNEIYDLGFKVMSNAAALKGVSVGGAVEVDLLPYFGAGYTDEEGYVFYPDGSGALTYFRKNPPPQDQFFSKEIYSEHVTDLDDHDLNRENGIRDIMMPVYGIKRNDHAFVGFMTEGEADSNIKFFPAGYHLDINRANFGFVYRRCYQPITKNWNGFSYKLMERERIMQDREAAFVFLRDDDASYSGMANRYRAYLLDQGKLKKSDKLKESMPFGLDLLMGIKEKRALKDKFIKMTTFEQAVDIVNELKDSGVKDMQINLLGWAKGGYKVYPSKYKLEGKLGSNRDFKKLVDTIKSNGYVLFLQDNLVDAYKGNGGFAIGNEVARGKSTKQISDRYNAKYIYSPAVALRRFLNKLLPTVGKFDIDGMAFEKMGAFIYNDYGAKNESTRQKTTEYWNQIMGASKGKLGSCASVGGNQYILNQVDRLISIPNDNTGYFVTDEAVPFYQMVIHGSIPYSSKPFNLFYDAEREKLKAIEYGCIPYYQLTYEDSEKLIYTSYNQLFTSKFEEWKDEAIEVYKEFNDGFKDTIDQYIVDHQKLSDDVYKIVYENGTVIYVNYSYKTQSIDGHEIEPVNYLVVRNGR